MDKRKLNQFFSKLEILHFSMNYCTSVAASMKVNLEWHLKFKIIVFKSMQFQFIVVILHFNRLLSPPGTPIFPSSDGSASPAASVAPRINSSAGPVSTIKVSRVCSFSKYYWLQAPIQNHIPFFLNQENRNTHSFEGSGRFVLSRGFGDWKWSEIILW